VYIISKSGAEGRGEHNAHEMVGGQFSIMDLINDEFFVRVGVSLPYQTREKVTMLESATVRVWFCAILLVCASCCGAGLNAQEKTHSIAPADYHIGIGDVLQVSVWQHPELSKTIPVKPDGKIALSLLKDVKVSGLSVTDLAKLLRDQLGPLIPSPQVTVIVTHSKLAHPVLHPSPQLRDTPSPELLYDCCVAREGL
jgi:hypothetical protein